MYTFFSFSFSFFNGFLIRILAGWTWKGFFFFGELNFNFLSCSFNNFDFLNKLYFLISDDDDEFLNFESQCSFSISVN